MKFYVDNADGLRQAYLDRVTEEIASRPSRLVDIPLTDQEELDLMPEMWLHGGNNQMGFSDLRKEEKAAQTIQEYYFKVLLVIGLVVTVIMCCLIWTLV